MNNLFNLIDFDGENMGILETTLDHKTVCLEWNKYSYSETTEYSIEEFVDQLFEKYPHAIITRFFLDDLIGPDDYTLQYKRNKR